MSFANGFAMPNDEYYKALTKMKRKPDEIEAWDCEDGEETKKRNCVIDSESSDDDDNDSRPLTDNDYPEAMTDLNAFHAFYRDIVFDVWGISTDHQFSVREWTTTFIKQVQTLAKKNKIRLSDDDGECVMIHVCCTMYAQKEKITQPRWERIKSMKRFYESNMFPRTKNELVEKRRTRIEIDDVSDKEEVAETNALTFLQTYELNAPPLAFILQKRAQEAGIKGEESKNNNDLRIYDHASLVPFLLPSLIDFFKDLVNPRVEIADDEPVRWGKHIFDDDDVLFNKITQHRSPQNLKLKLRIKNCEPGEESWFKQVKLEIAKTCGLRFTTEFPNKVKRDEQNRPLYTRGDIANMKIVYRKVMSDLKL